MSWLKKKCKQLSEIEDEKESFSFSKLLKPLPVSIASVQFSHSVVSDSLHPMNRSTPGLPVHHQLPEFHPNPCPLSW